MKLSLSTIIKIFILPLMLLSSAPVYAMQSATATQPTTATTKQQAPTPTNQTICGSTIAIYDSYFSDSDTKEYKCAAIANPSSTTALSSSASASTSSVTGQQSFTVMTDEKAPQTISQESSQPYPDHGVALLTATHFKDVVAIVKWDMNGNSKDIVFRNLTTNEIIAIWPPAHISPITALAVLPNGNLVSGSNGGDPSIIDEYNIKIWDTETGKNTRRCKLKTHTLPRRPTSQQTPDDVDNKTPKDAGVRKICSVSALAALSNTLIAIGVANNNKLYLWHTELQKTTAYRGHSHPITKLVVMSNGRLLSCDNSNTIAIWELHNKRLTHLYTIPHNYIDTLTIPNGNILTTCNDIDSMAILPDDKLAIGYHGDIFIWELSFSNSNATLTFIKKFIGHDDVLVALTITPYNQLVAGFSRGNLMKLNFNYS